MSSDIWEVLFPLAIGAFVLVHFPAKARRELRDGVTLGRYGKPYMRSRQPLLYWVVLLGNLAAGLIGLVLMLAAAAMRAL